MCSNDISFDPAELSCYGIQKAPNVLGSVDRSKSSKRLERDHGGISDWNPNRSTTICLKQTLPSVTPLLRLTRTRRDSCHATHCLFLFLLLLAATQRFHHHEPTWGPRSSLQSRSYADIKFHGGCSRSNLSGCNSEQKIRSAGRGKRTIVSQTATISRPVSWQFKPQIAVSASCKNPFNRELLGRVTACKSWKLERTGPYSKTTATLYYCGTTTAGVKFLAKPSSPPAQCEFWTLDVGEGEGQQSMAKEPSILLGFRPRKTLNPCRESGLGGQISPKSFQV